MGYKYRRTLPSEPLFLTKGWQKYYPALSPEFLQCLTQEMSVSLTKENFSTEGSYFAHLRRSLSPCTRGISQSEKQEYLVSHTPAPNAENECMRQLTYSPSRNIAYVHSPLFSYSQRQEQTFSQPICEI